MDIKSRAVNILHEINALHDRLNRPLVIFETGTIRNRDKKYEEGDGWSTLYIARRSRTARHYFFSIDLNTSVAEHVLWERGLLPFVTLIEGESTQVLKELINGKYSEPDEEGFIEPIIPDFVYLDTANDAQQILNEFLIVEEYAHVVMVDDVNLNSTELVKGHKVIPYARSRGYKVKLLERQAVIYLNNGE